MNQTLEPDLILFPLTICPFFFQISHTFSKMTSEAEHNHRASALAVSTGKTDAGRQTPEPQPTYMDELVAYIEGADE